MPNVLQRCEQHSVLWRNARIKACGLLFDAAANEYLKVDSDSEVYSERLRDVVLPAVLQAFPVPDDDRFIPAAIQMLVIDWESRRSPVDTPAPETPAQIIDRLRAKNGRTMEQLAADAGLDTKQVYKVKRGESVRTETILALAAALGCEAGDLLPRDPTRKRG